MKIMKNKKNFMLFMFFMVNFSLILAWKRSGLGQIMACAVENFLTTNFTNFTFYLCNL
jgi:hypothetical protein